MTLINEPDSLAITASWILRNKVTKEVVMETFDRRKVDVLNTAKYEAVPIYEYLQELNTRVVPAKQNPE